MDESALRALTRTVIDRETRPAAPFGTYLLRSADPAAALARHLEAEVFGEAFGNTPDLLAQEYDPYEDASVYCCVLDHRRARPAGVLRLILPGAAGLKSLVDIEDIWGRSGPELLAATCPGGVPARTWDIATLAVDPGYRDGLVSQALYQAACTSARHCAVTTLVAILDVRVLRLVQSRLGRPFQRYPDLASAAYLDSPASLPVWSDFEAWRARMATQDEVLHDVVFEGQGLEAAVSVPDWDAFWADGDAGRDAKRGVDRSVDRGAADLLDLSLLPAAAQGHEPAPMAHDLVPLRVAAGLAR